MSLLKDFGAGMLESINGKNGTLMGNSIFNGLGAALTANVVGGLLGGKEGARSMRAGITNAELTGAQREQNAFNAEEAQKARDFSEMQRQTQYQTAVNDMTAAGLNPAMMYQGAGSAASPTPSPAAEGSTPQSNKITDIVMLMKGLSEMKSLEAQTKNVESQTKINEIEAEHRDALLGSQIGLNESNIAKNGQEVSKLIQDIAESKSRVELNGKEMEVKDAQIAVFGSQVDKNEAEAALADANAFLASANTWQIQQLTPALRALHWANAHLANEKALTEPMQRYYLRMAGDAQNALEDLYNVQEDLGNLEFKENYMNYLEHKNLYDKNSGMTQYYNYTWDRKCRMWSTIGSLLGGAGSIGGVAADIYRTDKWSKNSPFTGSFLPSVPGNSFNPYNMPGFYR